MTDCTIADAVKESPFFMEIDAEFWRHKSILREWGKANSYSDIVNDSPYPKESLYRMIELIEIMDAMISYAPMGADYETVKASWYSSLI